jgi:hypothetical protein
VTTTGTTSSSPQTTTQPVIFSEANLQKQIDLVFATVPEDHTRAIVGYGAWENGQMVTKFALVGRSADGSWDFAAVAQYASKTGFGAGVYVRKSWKG